MVKIETSDAVAREAVGKLYRELGSRDFDTSERAFVADLAAEIVVGLRRSPACRPDPGHDRPCSPGSWRSVQLVASFQQGEARRMMALMPGGRHVDLVRGNAQREPVGGRARPSAPGRTAGARPPDRRGRGPAAYLAAYAADHVKSIFGKVGARSGTELMALGSDTEGELRWLADGASSSA